MSTVVVAGALANKAGSGGEAWVRLSWVRGLQLLGHDVWFVEELPVEPAPEAPEVTWFRSVIAAFDLAGRATLLAGEATLAGPPLEELRELAPDAVLVNISGHLAHRQLFRRFERRVLVDIDPGFTQVWHAQGNPGARVEGHDLHFTIGELIGTPACPIPTAGIDWLPVRQPVVLDDWPVAGDPGEHGFTTVASWRGPYGRVEFDGRSYGLKVHEFRRFLELPRRSPHPFELALAIDPDDEVDRAALEASGWRLLDPRTTAGSPERFRAFVQASTAEFSVAQEIYVDTACGWFSDRTVRYLASGRPALVQDTGFSGVLPVGDGLVAFRSLDEAIAKADDIMARYPEHASAARRIAEEHFAAERVLASFCERAGI